MTDPRELLVKSKTIAIVGVSEKADRPSNGVVRWLMDNTDYDLYFVNPALDSLFGSPVYKNLKDIPVALDIVDVFRKPADCLPVAQEALEVGAKAIWLQLGITSSEVAELARKAGIDFVEDHCIKIEAEKLKNS